MPITTTGNMPPPVQQSFHYKMLRVPVPNMIHKLFAMEKKMPSQGGDTIRFRRQFPLPTAIVPLGNSGVTPPSSIGSFIDIDAKVQFYGQWLQVNEQVQLTNQDPKMNGVYKSLLIDLETLWGDRAEGFCRGERLSEENSLEYATV